MKVLVIGQNHELRQLVANTLLSADFYVEHSAVDEVAGHLHSQTQLILVAAWDSRSLINRSAIEQFQAQGGGLYTILLLEAKSSIELVKEGLRIGADDFVFEPQNSAELILRVGIAERILNLKSANRETQGPALTPPKFQSRRPMTHLSRQESNH